MKYLCFRPAGGRTVPHFSYHHWDHGEGLVLEKAHKAFDCFSVYIIPD